ncbi:MULTISPECIES: hypothetical protein [Streptomyces]|uniref:hypothetical protein n=1 Tax=Streptomyces scabiei TaxID=1930 RepID=UPI001B304A3B|nr:MULTISPECIES: hypothetical protein [Streptomyces]MBP5894189.1 hypothetical protein [Streptomyces sp. LBUM 1481]MBP5917390.1 hypothetical protein [Streptomyces sp. LBUM 1486]MBP5924451.1 hypothetical protein [Streptomyces sp. LBUM 1483]MDX2686952.1 hypothetical protein [Streptomyces scabiei]MDX2753942.1 hypothetical protein [Streptomyces scabiei]
MNSERPDNTENPDEGPEPGATEALGAAGDDATGTDGAGPADRADQADQPGEPEAEAAEAGTAGDADIVSGGGDGRPGARRTRVVVASVAAAVLLVGGGGALLATTASDRSGADGKGSGAPGGDGTPPPLALDGRSGGGSNGIAPGEPNPNGVTYRAGGDLPEGPGSAPVYALKGEVTASAVARLAKALGVEGKPTVEGESWRAGAAGDGTEPVLRVSREAPGAWTFERYTPGTDDCRKADVCASDGSAGAGDPVSEAVARKAAMPVLKAVGQDEAKLDATQLMGAVRVVNADPEVGGLPTYGWATGIRIGADGQVLGGSGNLTSPKKGDTYPVVDADRALKLLNDSGQGVGAGRGGIGGCTGPVPLEGENGSAVESGTVASGETPCERMSRAPKPETVAVEKAVFGLASQQVDGHPALVPSWLYEVRPAGAAETYTVTQPAVDPAYLAAPEPGDGDTPPTGPSSREVPLQGYTMNEKGDELTVNFWGGRCSDYSASVSEKPDGVTVTVIATPWEGKVCVMIAEMMERTVRLDEPIDGRDVVGADGKEIPLGGPLGDR